MANLTTQHMGVTLKNPLILGASNLVNNLDKLKQAVLALKKFHGIDMIYLYDSIMAYYSLEYSSTHNHQQGIRRLRAIDFKTRC